MKSWMEQLFTANRARAAVKEHRKNFEIALPYLDKIYEAARKGHSSISFDLQTGNAPYIAQQCLKELGYYAGYSPRTGVLDVSWHEEVK